MLGHALIFDGINSFADITTLECQAFNTSFFEFGLPWIWTQSTCTAFGGIECGQERIRLHAADTGTTLSTLEIARIDRDVKRHFTARASRFGVPLRPGVEQSVARARREGKRVGLASRHVLAPAVRLYNGAPVKLDALGPDVAAVARVLQTAEMEVVRAADMAPARKLALYID